MELSSPFDSCRRLRLDSDDDEPTIPTQSPYFTQPTQVVDRKASRNPPAAPSSPNSIVEVPASSPFRPPAPPQRAGRFAHFMAPAGTAFKPPAARPLPVTKAGEKRPFIEISDDELDRPIYVGDSSDDDEEPSRGDIRPSSFKPKEPNVTAGKAASASSSVTSPEKSYEWQKDWVSLSPGSSNDSFESLQPAPAPAPTKRRRLVQGRRPRAEPSSPVANPSPKPSRQSRRTQLIDLVSDDDGDDDDEYSQSKEGRRRSSSPVDEEPQELDPVDERVLQYLNTCDVIGLVAIAKVKEESAKIMVSRQPFEDLEEAMRVATTQKNQKSRGKKPSRVCIGEEIVSAVREYTKALDGIDHVIEKCDKRAQAVKKAISTWNMEITGHSRNEAKSDDGKLMTPLSEDDSVGSVKAPLAQPNLMEGCTMKPFQIYGLNWLHLLYKNRYGGILADDMGLGKTCQVISLICALIENWRPNRRDDKSRPWPNLIVVPPSTLANWAAEFERFAPKVNVTVYQGNQSVRDEIAAEILDDPDSHHVVLTSYSQVSRKDDISNLKALRPVVAVFDEGHKLKNPKTKIYRDLLRITATWRLILSGTPVQNNLMEMVALLQFVEPDLFQEHFENLEDLFQQKVNLAAVSKGLLLHSDRVERARTILEPFILQRRKEQVLMDMPPKTTRVVKCKMDPKQAALYREYEKRFRKSDSQPDVSPVKEGRDKDSNNVWVQLRKSAIHPQLFRRHFKDRDVEKMAQILMKKVPQSELKQPSLTHLTNELKALSDFELHLWCRDYPCIREFDVPEDSWMACAKVKALLELIKAYRASGDRVLVFTRFAKMIEILGECLATEGIEYRAIQGSTDVSERQDIIDEFTEDETIPVFLLTTATGGTGINLTAANKVIIFDQSDNPQDDVQAENRAHRLGQTRPVEIIRLISEGTIEELVHSACEKKLELANKVTGWSSVEMTSAEMEAEVKGALMRQAAGTPTSD
ncbi:hypothetical protein VTJ83DRAFT_505 [Remersonia thermophila]|uniref:Uncharacterized protein n=1 Tax=Remersonia thermophila TaxID=72144 RepID=A0ABR4DL72_9PEZI